MALLLAYKYGRHLSGGHVATALHNAREVVGLERSLGVFSEARLQELVVSSTAVVRFLNVYYLVAHVAVTIAAFVWLYVRHPETYRRFRNVMVAITLAGMSVHLLFPLAPPRMLSRLGFIDTARIFGPASYGAGSPYKGFANQFAAMPSLHFGWALVIAWAVLISTSSRLRWLVLAHPVVTLAAIVLTANHYWLDAVVATFLFAAGARRRPGHRAPARQARGARRGATGGARPRVRSTDRCATTCRTSGDDRATVARRCAFVPAGAPAVARQPGPARVQNAADAR